MKYLLKIRKKTRKQKIIIMALIAIVSISTVLFTFFETDYSHNENYGLNLLTQSAECLYMKIVPQEVAPIINFIPATVPTKLSFTPLHITNSKYTAGAYKHHAVH